jgi:hypothetical protein
MRRLFILFFALSVSFQSFTQSNYNTWKKLRDQHSFQRAEDYKGVKAYEKDFDSENFEETEDLTDNDEKPGDKEIDYSPEEFNNNEPSENNDPQNNKNGNGSNKSGNGNSAEREIKDRPDPIKPMDFEPSSEINPSLSMGNNFATILIVILCLIIAVLLVFYFSKQKTSKQVKQTVDIEKVSPETISKSELEIKLEAAEANKNYRECIRILFIFVLKDLISKDLIRWNIDKTNADYKREMIGKTNASGFNRFVYIFDSVWYGEKAISEENYITLKPDLLSYYHLLSGKR